MSLGQNFEPGFKITALDERFFISFLLMYNMHLETYNNHGGIHEYLWEGCDYIFGESEV